MDRRAPFSSLDVEKQTHRLLNSLKSNSKRVTDVFFRTESNKLFNSPPNSHRKEYVGRSQTESLVPDLEYRKSLDIKSPSNWIDLQQSQRIDSDEAQKSIVTSVSGGGMNKREDAKMKRLLEQLQVRETSKETCYNV
jgi:hypothetical protein